MFAGRVVALMTCRNALKNCCRNYSGHIRRVTQNDMPVPKGDWGELNAARQRMHHLVLAIGVSSCGFGLFLYNQTNIVNFHFSPPSTYE